MKIPGLACCLLFPALAHAGGWEAPERLRAAAATALGGDAELSLDPNTRLPRCQDEPTALVRARGARAASVEIHCPRPAWRVYVPARMSGEARVAVLRRPVAAGERLSATDFELQTRATAGLGYGWFEGPEKLDGRRTRRALPSGAVPAPGDLEAERAIGTGDAVTLVSREHGIEVRMPGQAVSGGAAHQRIRVRNGSSGRIVEGVILDNGEVEVSAR